MVMQKFSGSLKSVLAFSLFALLAVPPLATAQSVSFKPKGRPEQTAGGAARGGCLQLGASQGADGNLSNPIAALIPATDGEFTATPHPTIMVKISQPGLRQAELSLWDENSQGIYQTTIALAGTAGIVGLQLPQDAPQLEVGKRYKFTVAVVCDAANRQRDAVVEGWVQRGEMSASLTQELNAADALKQAQLYAANGFWYDTVATLAALRQSQPEDTTIAAQWQELLDSVGLNELAAEPVVSSPESDN